MYKNHVSADFYDQLPTTMPLDTCRLWIPSNEASLGSLHDYKWQQIAYDTSQKNIP